MDIGPRNTARPRTSEEADAAIASAMAENPDLGYVKEKGSNGFYYIKVYSRPRTSRDEFEDKVRDGIDEASPFGAIAVIIAIALIFGPVFFK